MTYRLTARSTEQIRVLLTRSAFDYGARHQTNYRLLLAAAMEDVAAEPHRVGATLVSRRLDVWVYELWHSRNRLPRDQRIRDPWHKLLYRPLPDGDVEILAVVGRSYPSGRAAREALVEE